jgi:hypothetical protein
MGKATKITTREDETVIVQRNTLGGLVRKTRCTHLQSNGLLGISIYANGKNGSVHDVCSACLLQGTPFATIDEYWRNVAKRHAERWGGK